jgi:hypothetical protein
VIAQRVKQPALWFTQAEKKRSMKMNNIFYRISSDRWFVKLLSRPIHARLEDRRRVMFPKSSVFAVVALAAFVSLGAFLLPQIGQAQECIWDCDLGSDFFDNPGENSPGFSIVYCFDQQCVARLGISTGTIPTVEQKVTSGTCPTSPTSLMTIEIEGNVVAVLRDKNGLKPDSAAEASFNVVVNNVNCTGTSPSSTLSRRVSLTDSPADVIAGSITILAHSSDPNLDSPNWGGTGCPTDKAGILTANCAFPLGIDASNNAKQLEAKFPAIGGFLLNEVYHGNGLGRVVSMRMCKGDANEPSSSIACTVGGDVAVGGFVADAVFNFDGNWSGAGNHTFNPQSGSNPFDIIIPFFNMILVDSAHPVTAKASVNGGTPVSATGCNPMPSQSVIRCNFIARDLAPNGCTPNQPVDLVVMGNVFSADTARTTPVKFVSGDDPVCSR